MSRTPRIRTLLTALAAAGVLAAPAAASGPTHLDTPTPGPTHGLEFCVESFPGECLLFDIGCMGKKGSSWWKEPAGMMPGGHMATYSYCFTPDWPEGTGPDSWGPQRGEHPSTLGASDTPEPDANRSAASR